MDPREVRVLGHEEQDALACACLSCFSYLYTWYIRRKLPVGNKARPGCKMILFFVHFLLFLLFLLFLHLHSRPKK